MRDAEHPDQCVSTYDPFGAEYLDMATATTWLLSAYAPQECVNLFVVTDWDTVSPATQLVLTVPSSPAAPTPGARTWDPSAYAFRFAWARPDGFTNLAAMRSYDNPSVCPTTYDRDLAEVLYEETPGQWQLTGSSASQCVSLFAVTSWGTVSPRTQIVVQVPAPTATPAVGTVAAYASVPGAASATVSLPSSSNDSIGIEVVAGSCPASPPAGTTWFDGYQDGSDPARWVFYPEPYGDPGPQCVLVTALDSFGQHGPVVKRAFSVAP